MISATIRINRSDRRVKVFQRARVRRSEELSRGHILNLSAAGALIHSPAVPDAAPQIDLLFAGLERPCAIIWRSGEHAGVRFASRLTAAELTLAVQHEA